MLPSQTSRSERILAVIGALLAIFVFVTGIQSVRQLRSPKKERGTSSAPNGGAGVPAEKAAIFLGAWDGYLSEWRQNLDRSGKVVGETQRYEDTPSEEIFVTAKGDGSYIVRHRYKNGPLDETSLFVFRDGKLVREGTWRDFYKGQVPTIWRTPDGTVKYIDGVSELRLKPRHGQGVDAFDGLWLVNSEHLYLKIAAIGSDKAAMSPGITDRPGKYAQTHADGIEWQPPVTLHLVNGELRGEAPSTPGAELSIVLRGTVELLYTVDYGNGNRTTTVGRRITR